MCKNSITIPGRNSLGAVLITLLTKPNPNNRVNYISTDSTNANTNRVHVHCRNRPVKVVPPLASNDKDQ